MPARTFTATAREINGFSRAIPKIMPRMAPKSASDAITEPNPTNEAVLSMGSNEATAPWFSVFDKSARRRALSRISVTGAMIKATMIAHIPLAETKVVTP